MANPQTENGCIFLSRSILDSKVFRNEKWLKAWIWCLLRANHKEISLSVKTGKGNTVINIKRGQFVYGRHSASRALEMPPSTIRNIIALLVRWQNLAIQADTHYSIITVLNYDTYQDINTYRRTGKRTTKGQPKDTNNNDKNDNNIYSPNSDEVRMSVLLFSLIEKRNPGHKKPDLQKWALYVDRMIRLDNRKVDDIEDVIKWCQDDVDFWQNNILSTQKLREQFDQLKLKMDAGNGQHKNRSGVVL